jgi:predicted SpoU family rRNA methylase
MAQIFDDQSTNQLSSATACNGLYTVDADATTWGGASIVVLAASDSDVYKPIEDVVPITWNKCFNVQLNANVKFQIFNVSSETAGINLSLTQVS